MARDYKTPEWTPKQRARIQAMADGDYDPTGADCKEDGVHDDTEKCTRCCNCADCQELRLSNAEQAALDDPSMLTSGDGDTERPLGARED